MNVYGVNTAIKRARYNRYIFVIAGVYSPAINRSIVRPIWASQLPEVVGTMRMVVTLRITILQMESEGGRTVRGRSPNQTL